MSSGPAVLTLSLQAAFGYGVYQSGGSKPKDPPTFASDFWSKPTILFMIPFFGWWWWFVWFYRTRLHVYPRLAGKHHVTRLASNSSFSCLCILGAGIIVNIPSTGTYWVFNLCHSRLSLQKTESLSQSPVRNNQENTAVS